MIASNSEVVQVLVNQGIADPNIQLENGSTALIIAYEKGHSKVVETLHSALGLNKCKGRRRGGLSSLASVISRENCNSKTLD